MHKHIMELVSIVIPTYKRVEELERAIKSIQSQTYNNIEVIVIDDNTEDSISSSVFEIVQKYKNTINITYSRNKKNLGGALSRNEGLKIAKGKYVAFFDDDDEYYPTKIEKQLRKFKNSKYKKLAIVYCFTEAIDHNGKVIQVYSNDVEGGFIYSSMLNTVAATTQWLCLKEAIEAVGGFKDVPCKQDTTLLIDLALAGYEIDYVPEVLCKYHEDGGIRISNFGPKRIKGELILRDYMRRNYNGLSDDMIKKIEYNIGMKLYDLYINNYMLKEAKAERNTLIQNVDSVKEKICILVFLPKKLCRRFLSDCYKKIFSKCRI